MGAVWRAHDEQLGREVAVKELRLPEHLDASQRAAWIARLDREARAAARLKHPGIITVHDRITSQDGRPWIVMELVRGRSLADLISSEGTLSPQRAAEIGLQILAALQVAHRAGITHRDIKPANVLLEDGRVVLTDFGIAAVDGEETLTRSGAVLGTPAYMSPEQVRGEEATAESDLWSLGATLYTAVEGRRPFDGASTGAVFVAIATQPPVPPAQAGPLEPAFNGLLRKHPAERLTADQLHALLVQARQPAARQAVPPSPPPVPAAQGPGMAGGPAPWGGGPSPFAAPRRPRANAAAAAIAGILALLTAGMLIWFALDNVFSAGGPTGQWSDLVFQNVVGGVIGAGLLLAAAAFTFSRWIAGAWTLCALCVLYIVATIFVAPLLRGMPLDHQLRWIFGFHDSDGAAAGLAMVFGILTAIIAAIAGSVKSHGPTGAPPRP